MQKNAEEVRFEPDFEFIRNDPRFGKMIDKFSKDKKLDS